jgi:hypothetical protein
MQDSTIEIRERGFASFTRHGRLYKREPGSDGSHRWLRRRFNGWRAVSDRRARRCERLYHHPEHVKPFRRFPRLDPGLKLNQPVYCPPFGFGKIAAIEGDDITVRFGEQERQVAAQDLLTQAKAELHWHAYWLRGETRRFEEGKRLFIVKSLCRFGEWQAFLDKYDYPRSTADDLIRRYKGASAEAETGQLPGNRSIDVAGLERHVNERTPDSDADERKELVAQETAKRHGRKPSYHPALWSIRIKLPPDVLKLCHKKYKEPDAKEFWRRAAYRFVGLDPNAPDRKRHSRHRESSE